MADSTSAPLAAAAPPVQAALPYAPHPWTVQRSRRTGEPYFFNPVLNKAYSYDATLPQGWAWGRDSENGPRFFVKLSSGERRPAAPGPADAEGPSALAGSKRLSDEFRKDEDSGAGATTGSGAPEATAVKRARGLDAPPPGPQLSRLPVILELIQPAAAASDAPVYASAHATPTGYQLGLSPVPCVLQIGVDAAGTVAGDPRALFTRLHATPGTRLFLPVREGGAPSGPTKLATVHASTGAGGAAVEFTCVVVPPAAAEAAAVGGPGLLLAVGGAGAAGGGGSASTSSSSESWMIATHPTAPVDSRTGACTPLSWLAVSPPPAGQGGGSSHGSGSIGAALAAAAATVSDGRAPPLARFQVILEGACLQALLKGNIAPVVGPALQAVGVPPGLRVEAGASAGAGHRGGAAAAWFEGLPPAASSAAPLQYVCKRMPFDHRVAAEVAALYTVAGLNQASRATEDEAADHNSVLTAFGLGAASGLVPPLAVLRSFGPGGVVTCPPGAQPPAPGSAAATVPEVRILMARLPAPVQQWIDGAAAAMAALGPLRAPASAAAAAGLDAVLARGGAVSVAFLLDAWRRLLQALQRLHRSGLLYADMHPGNVMALPASSAPPSPTVAGGCGGVSLIDFGSARPLVHGVYTGPTRGGRWDYMPPEQFGPEKWGTGPVSLTPAADLFALAATVLGVAAGAPPFGPPPGTKLTLQNTKEHARRSNPELLRAHVAATLAAFTGAPGSAGTWRAPLEAALLACLAADAKARPQSAEAVLAMLAAVDA